MKCWVVQCLIVLGALGYQKSQRKAFLEFCQVVNSVWKSKTICECRMDTLLKYFL